MCIRDRDEFGDADLGDLRRTDRLVRIASKVVVSPECSLSKMMGNEADNKGAQRFWGSESFDYRDVISVSYTHLRAHETVLDLVCRLLLEKKQEKK